MCSLRRRGQTKQEDAARSVSQLSIFNSLDHQSEGKTSKLFTRGAERHTLSGFHSIDS